MSMSMRGHPTDPVKVGGVLALHKQGLSYKEIEQNTGVKRRTAVDLVHRAKTRANAGEKAGLKKLLDKENVNPKAKSGRPEAVSAREKRYLIRTAEKPENRRSTLATITEEAGLNISIETTHKYLNKSGLHWRKPRRKPILTHIQKRNRLKWCRDHKETDWSTWIFTDEMSIVPGQVRGRNGVWRRPGEEYQGNKGTVDRKKQSSASVMFWGAICSDIKGPGYVWIPETVKEKETATQLLNIENDELEASAQALQKTAPPTAKKRGRPPKRLTKEKTRKKGVKGIDWYRYRNLVLKPHLYPFFHKVKQQKGEAVVMEDGAGPHSHYLLKEERDKAGIVQEGWPSSSPDLNPIEIIWDYMKDSISTRRPKVTKITTLRTVLIEEWEAIPQEKINELVGSMPSRIIACIKDKGGNNYNF